MLRLIALAVLSMAMFVAAAGGAEAKVFRGKTTQGRRGVGRDRLGRAAAHRARELARPLPRSAGSATRPTSRARTTRRRPTRSPTRAPTAAATTRATGCASTSACAATRIADDRGERWRGTFRAKVLVTRRGRYVDTCRTGRLRFTLRPPSRTRPDRRYARSVLVGVAQLVELRVVVPAAAGSSPVAHPLRPCKWRSSACGRSSAGQTRGKFGAAKPLGEPSGGHVDRAVEPNIGWRPPGCMGSYPGGHRKFTQECAIERSRGAVRGVGRTERPPRLTVAEDASARDREEN